MGSCKYTDDAFTTIASNVAAIDTSIVVASNTRFSGLISGGTDHFFVTIVKSTSGAKETVKVTAAASTTWTVVRAQGPGDTALTFVVGDLVSMRIGKNLLDTFPQDDDLSGTGGAALIGKSGSGTVQDHITTITGTGGAAAVGKSGSGSVQDHITTITGTGGAAAVGTSTGSNVQTTMNAMPYDMTLAEFLANTPPLKAGDVVTISDLAGATFDIAAGVSGANTYDVIANTAGTLKATLRQFKTYNIAEYGVTANGVSDCTAAIRALSNDITSNSMVLFPPGRYYVDRNGADNLFELADLDNVYFFGYGAEIVASRDISDGAFQFFELDNCTNIKFQGFYFNYEVTAVTGATVENATVCRAIKPTAADRICENIVFKNCKFRMENTSSSGTWYVETLLGVSGPLPEGDTGVTPGYKIDCLYFSGDEVNYYRHKNIVCDSCEFVDMHARTFWIWCCEDIQFTNNVLHNKGARRPQIRIIVSNRNIKITGNTFYNDNTYSCENTIVLHRQSGSEDYAHAAIVSNNTFYYGKGTAVRVGGFTDVVCNSNVFRLNPLHANSFITNAGADANFKAFKVEITSANDVSTKTVVISNNTLDAESTYAYLVDGASSVSGYIVEGVVITGNVVSDSLGGATSTYACSLGVTSGWKNCRVTNNVFRNTNGVYLDSVLGMTVAGNSFEKDYGSGYGIFLAESPKVDLNIQGNNFANLNRGVDATSTSWPQVYAVYVTGDTGTFTGTLTGGTSGATGTISSKSADTVFGATARVVITSPSGRFSVGETVTAGGGGTATVLFYSPAAEKVRIMGNTFTDLGDVGIRNYVVESQIVGNVFYNCSSPTQLATGADYVYNVVN